jgi:large repetitive protein
MIARFSLFAAFSFFAITSYAQVPAITSFSPLKGPVGATVTIAGNNFNATPANNIVYFGAVRATVLTAATGSLTVRVPAGADLKPITVTTNGLTAYSQKPFHVTFPGGDDFFDANSFAARQQFEIGLSPDHIAAGDIDGDGKPDLASIGDPGGSAFYLSLLRNTSTHGNISFVAAYDQSFPGYLGRNITMGDLDADGKLEVVTGCSGKMHIFRNLSTPGTVSLATPLILTDQLEETHSVHVIDLDQDGKPDIVFANEGAVAVFKNNSTPGNIILAGLQTILPAAHNTTRDEQIEIEDLDGDLKPDIAITYPYVDSLYIIRNTSTPGNISFGAPLKLSHGPYSHPNGISIGDVDGDNLSDIAFANSGADRVIVYKNVSKPGSIAFTGFTGIANLFAGNEVTIGDINGDGKLDFAAARHSFQTIAIVRNGSTPCNAALDPFVEHGYITERSNLLLCDLNADSKPDLINVSPWVLVTKNTVGQTVKGCVGSNLSVPSSLTGSTYQWQQNTGAGFQNISDNANFSGTNSSLLQLNNVAIALNGNKFRCVVDDDTSNVFSASINATLVPAVAITKCPTNVCSGNTSTSFTATPTNGGPSPQFQWQDSSSISGWANIAGANSATLNFNVVTSGTKIRCLMTSGYGCAAPASATSNTVILTINPTVTPTNSISGNTSVTQGQATTLSAMVTNAGSFPLYQWQDSTDVAAWADILGANSSTINYTPAKTGNKIRCILTNTNPCASPATVNSNALVFTVNSVTGITPVPGTGYNIVYFPNPAYKFLHIDSLKLNDNWHTVEIIAANGTKALSQSITGLTKASINITALPRGMYFAILRRKTGAIVSFRFVKQ